MMYGGLRGAVAFALCLLIDPKVRRTLANLQDPLFTVIGTCSIKFAETLFRLLFSFPAFFFSESPARAHVRDDDHRHGLLDRLRAGHHHQAAGEVPQRQDDEREGPDHERAHRRPLHGPRRLRDGGHPRRARKSQVRETPDAACTPYFQSLWGGGRGRFGRVRGSKSINPLLCPPFLSARSNPISFLTSNAPTPTHPPTPQPGPDPNCFRCIVQLEAKLGNFGFHSIFFLFMIYRRIIPATSSLRLFSSPFISGLQSDFDSFIEVGGKMP